MPDRTRPIRKEICLNEQELNLIQHKMRQLGTHNFGAYARKMLIDGYIIKVDYTEQKKLAAAVNRAASNINQICRRINSTGHFYDADVAKLKARQAEIWELLLDRASISRQNGYVEPDGTIRLYFTLEQAQAKLHRSRQSATRIFRELEYSGLIVRRKQGLGKPALITLNYPADAKLIAKEGEDAQA